MVLKRQGRHKANSSPLHDEQHQANDSPCWLLLLLWLWQLLP